MFCRVSKDTCRTMHTQKKSVFTHTPRTSKRKVHPSSSSFPTRSDHMKRSFPDPSSAWSASKRLCDTPSLDNVGSHIEDACPDVINLIVSFLPQACAFALRVTCKRLYSLLENITLRSIDGLYIDFQMTQWLSGFGVPKKVLCFGAAEHGSWIAFKQLTGQETFHVPINIAESALTLTTFLNKALVGGNVAFLNAAERDNKGLDSHLAPPRHLCELAAESGNLDAYRWAHGRHGHLTINSAITAVGKGSKEILEYYKCLKSKDYSRNASRLFREAVRMAHTNIVIYILENSRSLLLDSATYCYAALQSNNDYVMRYICEEFGATECCSVDQAVSAVVRTPNNAAAGEYLHEIGLLDGNSYAAINPYTTFLEAIASGSLENVEWLYELCGKICPSEVLEHAASRVRSDIFLWLADRVQYDDSDLSDIAISAAKWGNIDILNWLKEKHPAHIVPRLALVASSAKTTTWFKSLKWLVENGIRVTEKIVANATKKGDKEALLWIVSRL